MDLRRVSSPIGVDNYLVKDPFWSEKMELVRTHMIPYQWRVLNDAQEDVIPSHCIKNFRIAAGLEEGKFEGYVFQDSDLAKWLEAVGYCLSWHKDPELEALADGAIDLICLAQRADGYMDTYYIINGLDKAWTNIADNHEMYCAGHMIEAAVAYYAGTGKRKLLDAVMRLADCIDCHFGPEEGKLHGYPGHEILEMALIRLYHVTNEERYLHLAEYFINERGKTPNFFMEERVRNGNDNPWKDSLFKYKYYQAERPVREQTTAEGHAVRAVYLYSGMTDVAKETGDDSLWKVCKTLWEDVSLKQMYITGAIGASPYGEAFSYDYDLPNDTIYGETCASIGLSFWARRMLETEMDRKYAEVMERCLFNSILSGTSMTGTGFFYVNPLEVVPEASEKDEGKRHVLTRRRKWFNCACCPPNLARIVSSVGNYACTEREDMLAFHLYIGGFVNSQKTGLKVEVNSELPWNGRVSVRILESDPKEISLLFRVPTWCGGDWSLSLNGSRLSANMEKNGYAELHRHFALGDLIELNFAMPVLLQHANPRVREDIGKVAVTRGPLVYCLEEDDMGKDLHLVRIDKDTDFITVEGRVLPGTLDIEAKGFRMTYEQWDDTLYSPILEAGRKDCAVHMIPYHLWCNRNIGEMLVWLHEF